MPDAAMQALASHTAPVIRVTWKLGQGLWTAARGKTALNPTSSLARCITNASQY
jgi:hypothetical protein